MVFELFAIVLLAAHYDMFYLNKMTVSGGKILRGGQEGMHTKPFIHDVLISIFILFITFLCPKVTIHMHVIKTY